VDRAQARTAEYRKSEEFTTAYPRLAPDELDRSLADEPDARGPFQA